jgi:hypothetical protein
VLLAVLLAAQPAEKKPDPAYTAFPDLKPPPMPGGDEPDREAAWAAYDKAMAGLVTPKLPAPAAAPTPLQRVQFEQVRAGAAYLEKMRHVIAIGRWEPEFFAEYLKVAAEVHKVAADLDGTPAGRVKCYEARVVLMKELERFVGRRQDANVDPPQHLDLARFHRLQAEADLLKLVAEAEKAGKK